MLSKLAVVIGCDHAGFLLKEFIKKELSKYGIPYKDAGAFTAENPSDYPVYVAKVAGAVSSDIYKRGIAVCGTGIGSSIVANRFPGVRAALCRDEHMASIARTHTDSNVLVLGGGYTTEEQAARILQVWLTTRFEGGRHAKRVNLIDNNTQLALALDHLGEVDTDGLDMEAVNRPFIERAFRGLQKIKNLFGVDRRDDSGQRLQETCQVRFSYDGRDYKALMVDLSARGARLRIDEAKVRLEFLLDDDLTLSVKTPYGLAACTGRIRWIDSESKSLGLSFSSFPKDPRDPLRLMLD